MSWSKIRPQGTCQYYQYLMIYSWEFSSYVQLLEHQLPRVPTCRFVSSGNHTRLSTLSSANCTVSKHTFTRWYITLQLLTWDFNFSHREHKSQRPCTSWETYSNRCPCGCRVATRSVQKNSQTQTKLWRTPKAQDVFYEKKIEISDLKC